MCTQQEKEKVYNRTLEDKMFVTTHLSGRMDQKTPIYGARQERKMESQPIVSPGSCLKLTSQKKNEPILDV